jgi:hypothetical protein
MATDALTAALLGLNTSAADTPYGLGALTVAQTTPQMMDPYGSWQRNLAVGLGGTLVTALLGYQARQQALEQNLALQPYITRALKAPSMEALDVIMAEEGGAPLRSIGAQLKMNLLENQAAAAKRQAELKDALTIEAVKEGYVPKGFESLFPAPTGAISTDGVMRTPKEAREYAQKQELIKFEKQQEAIAQEPARAAAERDDYVRLGETLKAEQPVKDFMQVQRYNKTIRELAANPTRANIDAMITLVKKSTDPNSVTTLGEFAQVEDQQSAAQRYTQALKNIYSSNPRVAQEAINQMVEASDIVTNALGRTYNEAVRAKVDQAKALGFTDPNETKLSAPYYKGMSLGTANTAASDESRLAAIRAEIKAETDPIKVQALKQEATGIYQRLGRGR